MAKQTESSKTGVKPGATPSTTGPQGGARPIEEEDTFGGAERVRKTGEAVKSENAKP
jgi:hypothetical protein